ncbi:MAG: helix-turn-helix domain-containing protein [Bacteroides thetaiotaomicron]
MKMKLVTVREAADFLRISYRTAQRYLAEGRIPYTKPAGRVLIKEQDLMNFVNMTVNFQF